MKFRLRRDKPVRRVIRKLFAYHVERCRSLLLEQETQPGRVHEVRKSVKRMRALTSLVGEGLGKKRRWLDRQLRDINRLLSPVRDAESLHEAFDRVAVAEDSPPDEFAVVRACLITWSDQHERPTDTAVQDVCEKLDRIERRWKRARLKGQGWSLLEDNVRRAYRDCRRTVRGLSSDMTAAELHELRKLVKQTQYHWDFLQSLCPVRLDRELAELEALSDCLGSHHDAEMLKAWLHHEARHGLSSRSRDLVVHRLDRQQRQLADEVRQRAPLVFAESPRTVCRRLHDYWKAWRDGQEDAVAVATPSPPAVLQSVGP
jgi:CHAD domain-containing protein